MNSKSQVVMISLWILVILTMLTVSVGHRVAMAMRISRYQKDSLKTMCLAKGAVNRAILELDNDKSSTTYDAPDESWADNEEKFGKIVIQDDSTEFATVCYEIIDENSVPKTIYGVVDEERKININNASQELLIALLTQVDLDVTQINEITNYIRVWRGDDGINSDAEEYKNFKKAPFSNLEELVIVLEFFYKNKEEQNYQKKAQEVYKRIKDLITVYDTGGLINVNTADGVVLTILANSLSENPIEKDCVSAIIKEICNQRTEKNYFKSLDEIVVNDELVGGTSADINLFNKLKNQLTVNSDYFKIEAKGHSGEIEKGIIAIYDRANKKIAYWHESLS